MEHRVSSSLLPGLLLPLLALASCGATLGSEELTPEPVRVEKRHAHAVRVETTASPSGFLASPRISARNLANAITEALRGAKLFHEVGSEPSDFTLEARVLTLEESDLSVDRRASLTIAWRLVDEGGHEAWSAELTTEHTAHTYNSDAFEDRQLVAIREATQANIEQALRALGTAEL